MSTVTPVAGLPIAIFSGAVFLSSAIMGLMTALDLYVAALTPATQENVGVFCTSVDSVEEI
jgi:hypothetical protein